MKNKLQDLYKKLNDIHFADTFKHGSIYMFANIILQVFGVINISLMTKLQTTEDFGVYELTINTMRILSVVFILNITNGLNVFIYDLKYNSEKLISDILSISLALQLIFSIIALIFAETLMHLLQLPNDIFIYIIILSICNNIFNLFYIINTYKKDSILNSQWTLIFGVARIVSSLLFIYFIHKNYLGRLQGEAFSLIILIIIIYIKYFRKYKISIDKETLKYTKELIRYSILAFPLQLSSLILNYVDSYMINRILGKNETGLYSFAYKISTLSVSVISSFSIALKAEIMHLVNRQEFKLASKQIVSYLKLIAFFTIGVILFSYEGSSILTQNNAFMDSVAVIPIIFIGLIIAEIGSIYFIYINYTKKIVYYIGVIFFATIINIGLNYFLIPMFGYKIASVTTLISSVIILIMSVYLVKYVIGFHVISIKNIFNLFVFFIAISALYYGIIKLDLNYIFVFLLKLFIVIIAALFLWKNQLQNILNNNK